MTAVACWEQENGEARDATDFVRGVLPGLQYVPLRVVVEAPELSEGYCYFVRREQKVPHRRHWGALAKLGDLMA